MRILVGCEMTYEFLQPTPVIATLNVHASRFSDLERPDYLITSPAVPLDGYRDSFGNWCNRMVAPAGRFTLKTDTIVRDHGRGDLQEADAQEIAVEKLPSDTVLFLLGSRYCETDRLSSIAWDLFGHFPPGWGRVQAICDYVHERITFGYEHARPTRTAFDVFEEQHGVCRDYAHLAITFCRCLNIPTRYCNGYVSDIGLPLPHAPGDFAAWMEVYLGGRWHTFDPRNNSSRIGRILISYGRDAADVPLTLTFGANNLVGFHVTTEEAPHRS
ncbi:transglutaminase-like domain-containing protein [Methylobacterium sp. PvR107]|uniref:transglutaminase-like domain-containing protein n=1 Tax=Methylobacterium sp. PvR107 TaxID=2806597 RepID=UPI001AE16200|nr:transglutaminase family protein [Methylobacterium sp. PvR107]MBP1179287.1 transglutaminase-like putative cysteine protease [Methylobacterium sp. PvR107]